ncbi:MAG TPA: tetrahydrofolate dehydrogenase/cyclohydrolase catalytic domain-containing protein, partial [Flavobacteriales bacterium]|nr:tetrahydrofolate dehydrogenase/cyclohydrolase catalytic domain-containing protein [Flavobacteriales bacterium]
QTYVGSKVKACEEVGFRSSLLKRPADIAEADLLRLVDQLNNDPQVDGFIVQLPLPKHINEERITLAIAPGKD